MVSRHQIFKSLALALVFLSGAARADTAADVAQKRYFECTRYAGAEYVSSSASPTEVAEAAQSKCERELRNFELAFREDLRPKLNGVNADARAADAGRRASSDMKEHMRATVIRWTIEARSAQR